jgi:hypothetical protein
LVWLRFQNVKQQNGLLTFIFLEHISPLRAQTASLLRFLDHTQLHTHIQMRSHAHTHRCARTQYDSCTTHNKHNSLRGIRTRNPSNRAAGDLKLRPHDPRVRLAQFYSYCVAVSVYRKYGYREGTLYCGYVKKRHLFCMMMCSDCRILLK